jgi:hypothetical protein
MFGIGEDWKQKDAAILVAELGVSRTSNRLECATFKRA